jgi:tetratricopeptide (TPR) repeat protein
MSWKSRALALVLAIALPSEAAAQIAVPLVAPDEDEDSIADPVAQASAPRGLTGNADLPEIPAQPPDRFASMSFENRSPVRALDWLTAGGPLELSEKVERTLRLQPAYDAWVVPTGPVIPGTADTVASFAARSGARWVFTGWVARPNWQLRLVIALWRVDGGVAVQVGEVDQVQPFASVHTMIGNAIAQLAGTAGWPLTADQVTALGTATTRDLYSFTLVGRGVAHERGTLGRVDVKLAQHDLERAIFIEPTMAMAQRLAGQLYLDHPKEPQDPRAVARSQARAAGKFAYAVDLDPGYLPALRAAATAARAAGKHEISKDLYDHLVRARPWDLDARVYLGEALWQSGEGEAALRELGRVIGRAPDDLRARRLLALVHAERGDLAALVTALEEIAQRAPEDLDVRLDLGATYMALGRWDDARNSYVEVATRRPADANVLKLVGDVERHRGDTQAAVTWYGKMEKVAIDDPRPPFLIAQAWLAAGDLERAHKALIRTQRHKAQLGYAYSALGAVQYLSGHPGEAMWYLKRAAKQRPHSATARIALARVLIKNGQGEAALAQVAAARVLGGSGPQLDYLAALAHGLAGDFTAGKASAQLSSQAGLPEGRRAVIALGHGEVPAVEGAPTPDIPFGDIVAFEASIDGFLAADASMLGVRKALDDQVLTALVRMGEGPGKDLSKAARKKPRPRVCPVVQVARPFVAARKLERELYRRGLVLEETYRKVALLDALGEDAGLTPDYRRKIAEVRRAWKRALVGVREVKSQMQVGLGRELKARRCKDAVLIAAAAHPELYGKPEEPKVVIPPTPAGPPRARPSATVYVDNRECTQPLEVWIDGEEVGSAPAGTRAGFEAASGQRTLCLLQPGDAACGDRGTVRQAYLYDGWSTLVHCRGGTARTPP